MKKLTTLLFTLFAALSVSAEIRLPSIISSGMVLQREADAKIWGWVEPNTKVTVTPSWITKAITTTSDDNGKWIVTLPTTAVSWSESITISSGKDRVELSDIAIGDVWICSGQSNMEMTFEGSGQLQPTAGAIEALIEASRYPNLRLFSVGRNSQPKVQEDCKVLKEWCTASSATIVDFSAVAYFFGRTITQVVTDVPIALINVSWGGSRIEAWISADVINALGDKVDVSFSKSTKTANRKIGHLYNGMVAPIVDFAAKGFLWYQGEANRSTPDSYDELMVAMVDSWRKAWGSDSMPFYAVQLPPFNYTEGEMTLPKMIEAQSKAIARIPNSGLVGTTDLGNPHSIHPALKRPVGERLAFLALKRDYGHKEFPNASPTYKSMMIADGAITLSFNNLGAKSNSLNGYEYQDRRELQGFEIAGEDKVFYPAIATIIKGQRIKVSSKKVSVPVAVRYAFENNPTCNVQTGYGMPLIPFRTDDWELSK